MRKYFLYLIIAVCCLQCTESDFNDLGGPFVLKGVAVIRETLNGVQNDLPAKNIKVYLKYAGNTNGFLSSTTADAAGQFSFNGIDPDRSYTIYSLVDSGAVKYYGENVYNAGSFANRQSDPLVLLTSQNMQNGIHLTVTNGQGPVPNVTAWVFNNPALFNADASAGRSFDITTNQYGVGNKLNIAEGTYYLRVMTRIGLKDYTGEDIVQVQAKGITNSNIILQDAPLPRNGIEAIIKDEYGTLVGNVTVYVYRSRYVFENDTEDYSNSLFTITSDQSGFASVYMLPPDTYYLRAVKMINDQKLTDAETVVVPQTGISPVNFELH